MSERTYEARPRGTDEAWEPITFEAMWADIAANWDRNPDYLLTEMDEGMLVRTPTADYRKAEAYA